MSTRKIIQILQTENNDQIRIIALCDDGTLWAHNPYSGAWSKLEDIPQDEPTCEDKG